MFESPTRGLELVQQTGDPTGFSVSGHKLTLSGAGVGARVLDNIAGNNTWLGQSISCQ